MPRGTGPRGTGPKEMGRKTGRAGPATIVGGMMLLALTSIGAAQPALAQPATPAHGIPQAIRLEHVEVLARLTAFARRRGPVGVESRKLLELMKVHFRREEDFIMPPLTLLHALSRGQVTPDMKWAITMADRVKAEREQIFEEHTRITEGQSRLLAAAERAHDTEVADFARGAAADALADMELMEPMNVVIGDYLRSKLPPAQ
jgi:hypothetical protein